MTFKPNDLVQVFNTPNVKDGALARYVKNTSYDGLCIVKLLSGLEVYVKEDQLALVESSDMTDYETQLRDEIYKEALRQFLQDAINKPEIQGAFDYAPHRAMMFTNKAMQARKKAKQ